MVVTLFICVAYGYHEYFPFIHAHRVINSFVNENSDQLNANCLDKVIALCISEMTKSTDNTPDIQNPCSSVLVAAGRFHCSKVMEGLLKELQPNHVGHFMLLECIGNLATANTTGIAPFIRQTLETILSAINAVRLDHHKYAYSFGKYNTHTLANEIMRN